MKHRSVQSPEFGVVSIWTFGPGRSNFQCALGTGLSLNIGHVRHSNAWACVAGSRRHQASASVASWCLAKAMPLATNWCTTSSKCRERYTVMPGTSAAYSALPGGNARRTGDAVPISVVSSPRRRAQATVRRKARAHLQTHAPVAFEHLVAHWRPICPGQSASPADRSLWADPSASD